MSDVTLTDQECGDIVRASIDPTRILAGRDGYNGSPPDVLLVTVERILSDRLAAAEADRERIITGVRKWCAINEIAAPPLDWAGLGEFLDRTQERGDGNG